MSYIIIILIIISLPFLFSFFIGNYTATAIGLVILGASINMIMFEQEAKSRSMLYMWIAFILIIAVLLGVPYVLPGVVPS